MDQTSKLPISEPKKYTNKGTEETSDLEIFIPQRIESTTPAKKVKVYPYLPSKLSSTDEDYTSKKNLFKMLLTEESKPVELPKVKNVRNKDFYFRPYSPLKTPQRDSPVIKDFRSTSRAKSSLESRNQSPELRNSFYVTQRHENNYSVEGSAVPPLRRVQIKEVLKIKKKFASKKMICPVRVLEGGLIFSDFIHDLLPPENFPKGGELLMQGKKKLKNTPKKKKKGKKNKISEK